MHDGRVGDQPATLPLHVRRAARAPIEKQANRLATLRLTASARSVSAGEREERRRVKIARGAAQRARSARLIINHSPRVLEERLESLSRVVCVEIAKHTPQNVDLHRGFFGRRAVVIITYW